MEFLPPRRLAARAARNRTTAITARRRWWPLLVLVVTVLGTTAPQRADEFSFSAPPPQLLVLFDGRVLYGRITERPGGYLIEQPGGSVVIPFAHIRLAAVSLDEAYIKQRDALKNPTAGDHLQLAQWCYDNQLYTHARQELADALRLEPLRSDARALLQKIADASPEPARSKTAGESPSGAAGSLPRERSPSGLRPQTNAEFVRRIQPLLINKCGNASCHGSAGRSEFRLQNVRAGRRQQRLETDSNLAAVIDQIDLQRARQSPLLLRPVEPGSQTHQKLFSGPGGAAQLEKLREWVLQAAADLNPQQPHDPLWPDDVLQADAGFGADDPPGVQPADFQSEPESPLLIEIPRTPASRTTSGPSPGNPDGPSKRADRNAELLKSILDQERPDAFDPDAFNRKVHGRTVQPQR